MTLLEVQHLKVSFPARSPAWGGARQLIMAVDDVSFTIAPGETLGLVGESGCGKTTLGRAIVQLQRPDSGNIIFNGKDLARLSRAELRAQRRQLQMVFQDPYSSLNPRRTVGDSIGEALDLHGLTDSSTARRHRITELLKAVGLETGVAQSYPHEFSGGQRQRIGIARALAVAPKLIVCDEPVSALDVSVQAQIVNLLQDLQQQHGLAYLFISHDIAVVQHVSHRIMVMPRGRIVEMGETTTVIQAPQHAYTQSLIAAIPQMDFTAQ